MIITVQAKGYARTVPANLVADVMLGVTAETHTKALQDISVALQKLSEALVMSDLGTVDQVGNPMVAEEGDKYKASLSIKKVVNGSNPLIAEVLSNLLSSSPYVSSVATYYELDEDQLDGLTMVCIRDCQQRAKQRAEAIYRNSLDASEEVELTVKLIDVKLDDVVISGYADSLVDEGERTLTSSDACVSIQGQFRFDVVLTALYEDDLDPESDEIDFGDDWDEDDWGSDIDLNDWDEDMKAPTEQFDEATNIDEVDSEGVGVADLEI